MAVVDIITVLRAFVENEVDFEWQFGAQALTAAQDMRDAIVARLQVDMSDDGLWEEFSSDPEGTEEELAGTIEAIIEADSELAMRLSVLLREFEQGREREGEWAEVLVDQVEGSSPPVDLEDDDIEADIPETATELNGDEYNEEGTYLRGNVDLGAVSIDDRPAEMAPVFSAEYPEKEDDMMGQGAEDLVDFDADHAEVIGAGMYDAVQTHPDLNDEERDALRAELRMVMDLVRQGDCADRELLIMHLERMCGISSDLVDLLLFLLTDSYVSLGAPVREAARIVRERIEGSEWPD